MCRPASSARRASNCSTGSTTTPYRRAGVRRRGGRPRYRARILRRIAAATARRPRSSSAPSMPGSVDALFEEAARRNLRLIAGKVLMDRKAPPALLRYRSLGLRPVEGADRASGTAAAARSTRSRRALPVTSTPEQLGACRQRCGASIPDVFVQTHIVGEPSPRSRASRELFPQRRDYLDVYAHYGLTGRRAVLAHGVHFGETRIRALPRGRHGGLALPDLEYLSGQRPVSRMREARDPRRPVQVGLGTDIGGGTSFSLLATMGEAYKVAQLRGQGDRRHRGVLSRDAGRRACARARRQDRHAGARPRGRHGGARPQGHAAAGVPQRARALDRRD